MNFLTQTGTAATHGVNPAPLGSTVAQQDCDLPPLDSAVPSLDGDFPPHGEAVPPRGEHFAPPGSTVPPSGDAAAPSGSTVPGQKIHPAPHGEGKKRPPAAPKLPKGTEKPLPAPALSLLFAIPDRPWVDSAVELALHTTSPTTAEALSQSFSRAKPADVQEILESLVALGRARKDGEHFSV